MPDTWEYPWYAAWDLAFHCVALAHVDPEFAKEQLILLLPRVVHAPERPAARLRVGVRRRQPAGARLGRAAGVRDRRRRATTTSSSAIFHKLLLNFTWWVNRKDAEGNNVFEGGFLGLDNIGPFDRSALLPVDGAARAVRRHGVDGDVLPEPARDRAACSPSTTRPTRTSRRSSSSTSRCIAVGAERARACGTRRTASTTTCCTRRRASACRCGCARWSGCCRSRAVTTLGPETLARLPDFTARVAWFIDQPARGARGRRSTWTSPEHAGLAAALDRRRASGCAASSRAMLDADEFLSATACARCRASTRRTRSTLELDGVDGDGRLRAGRVDDAACSAATRTGAARSGSRSTTCSIEALRVYHRYLGDDFTVEYPTGSGRELHARRRSPTSSSAG